MQNLTIVDSKTQLPDTLEDLTQFVLVGKAKLQAYMLKLQTVNKLSVAQEIRDQTLKETQEVSNALIAAEQRIGELLLAIQKQSGMRTDLETSSERVEKVKTKGETISEMGYSKDEASDYQQMAKHPEVVQKVIDDALANGDVVTKASVMREIKHYKDRVKAQQEEIENLRNQKPKVIEKEVTPDDYEELKDKARRIDGYKKDFADMRKEYDAMSEKWKRAEKEKQSMLDELNKPEREKAENIKRSALFFCAGVSNFIEKYGGYVWLSQELDSMEQTERDGYIKAIDAVYAWATQMKANVKEKK